MICWIHESDRFTYEELMREEGAEPIIKNHMDSNIQVVMTQSVAQIWHMAGYWSS